MVEIKQIRVAHFDNFGKFLGNEKVEVNKDKAVMDPSYLEEFRAVVANMVGGESVKAVRLVYEKIS